MVTYNNPWAAQLAGSLAQMFAPPSPQEMAALTQMQLARAKGDREAQLWGMAGGDFDKSNIAIGNYAPTQSYYAQNQNTDTERRGQDITAATSRANNANTVKGAAISDLFGAMPEGYIRPQVPANVAGTIGLPEIAPAAGLPKPLSETEQKALERQQLRDQGLLSDQDIADAITGAQAPVKIIPEPGAAPIYTTPGAAARTGAPAFVDKGNSTTINMGGGSDKQIFDQMSASHQAAMAAANGLRSIATAEQTIKDGIISGSFADTRLAFAKLGAALGVSNPETIVNTETFRAAIAPQVAALMKATVGSTQISNADREFAEKAAGGSITLDAASIARLLGIMKTAQTDIVTRYQQQLDAVYPNDPQFARERALFGGVSLPSAGGVGGPQPPQPPAPPAPPTPAGPQPGTVMDGYRFLGGDPSNPASWEAVQ